MEFIAQIITSAQMSEDHWEIIRPTLRITGTTTVKEIYDWANKKQHLDKIEIRPVESL